MNAIAPDAPTSSSDEDLVAGYRRGDAACFDELVSRYHRPVYAFCVGLTRRPEDAEDLVQDIFIQILRSLPTVQTDRPLRPWIFVVARHKCLDYLKRRRVYSLTDIAADDAGEPRESFIADAAPSPDELVERADVKRTLDAAITVLPKPYREVVVLRYASDLTFAEIGGVLGRPENTVKTHFQRAKALLRVRLAALAR